ncbi:MAG: hypothetical protein WBR26_19735 [Candidatus Acidiferrum sp.]
MPTGRIVDSTLEINAERNPSGQCEIHVLESTRICIGATRYSLHEFAIDSANC